MNEEMRKKLNRALELKKKLPPKQVFDYKDGVDMKNTDSLETLKERAELDDLQKELQIYCSENPTNCTARERVQIDTLTE